MTGGVLTFMSFNRFLDARTSLLFFQVILLERPIELSFEILSRDVFLCFAGFLWEETRYLRRGTWWTLLCKTEGKDFCICGKLIGTLGEYKKLVRSSSKNFDCSSQSGKKNFEGMDPVFVQKRDRSYVRGDKSINEWPQRTDVASRSQSTSTDPRLNCALNALICITLRGDSKGTMCVFWSSTSGPS